MGRSVAFEGLPQVGGCLLSLRTGEESVVVALFDGGKISRACMVWRYH